ncbi:MAG: MerR family transcriptional regulator [Deltaproteobacteria bacterium]|nr:MerR family transcriptional regulator [Deltaproteobacteria bacterium]
MSGGRQTLTIGQVAQLSGVGIETIRFYEREGLIPEPPRRESGYRDYPPEVVKRIQFIKKAQELGFSLKDAKELLSLRIKPNTTCAVVKTKASQKIASIDEKIQDLERMKSALAKLTTACDERGPISECPILDAVEAGIFQAQSKGEKR